MIYEKIMLGLSLSAPFGPLSAEAMRRGLNGGFMPVFQTRFGGAIGNVACLILAYFCLSFLQENPVYGSSAGFIGSIMLLLLGYNNLRQARKTKGETKENKLAMMFSNCLLVGFILAVANPFGIAWWFSVFTTSMVNETSQAANQSIQSFAPNLYVIVGVLIWVVTFSSIVAFAHKLFSKKTIYWINILAGIGLMYYGVKMGYVTFHKFMEAIA